MSDPHAKPTHHVAETAPLHDPVDEWHDHSHDNKPQHAHGEVQNSNLILGVGLALTGVIVVSCLVVYGFYTHYNTQRSNQREHMLREGAFTELANSPTEVTRASKLADLILLSRGGTTEMPTETENVKKTITISPIDKAMDEVAQGYTARRISAGN
jgi:hypothetical protein